MKFDLKFELCLCRGQGYDLNKIDIEYDLYRLYLLFRNQSGQTDLFSVAAKKVPIRDNLCSFSECDPLSLFLASISGLNILCTSSSSNVIQYLSSSK